MIWVSVSHPHSFTCPPHPDLSSQSFPSPRPSPLRPPSCLSTICPPSLTASWTFLLRLPSGASCGGKVSHSDYPLVLYERHRRYQILVLPCKFDDDDGHKQRTKSTLTLRPRASVGIKCLLCLYQAPRSHQATRSLSIANKQTRNHWDR